jgi:predicted nucleic acid-binding Zn ribbon protein
MARRVAEIFPDLGKGFAETIKACQHLSCWTQVVDERVSKHTEAIKIKNQTLYITTSSPAWAQELTFLKREIIIKFNQQAGEEVITDIRFRSGGE